MLSLKQILQVVIILITTSSVENLAPCWFWVGIIWSPSRGWHHLFAGLFIYFCITKYYTILLTFFNIMLL